MSQPRRLRDLLDSGTETLPCGENLDDILAQAADGHADQRTAHQRSCPHCQAALREFTQLWQPISDAAAEPLTVPAALKAAVTAQIRRLVADVWYTLQITDGGTVRVAARVVATIARDTARKVPGVRVALGRSTESKLAALVEEATLRHRHPQAAVGVLGRTAVVDLALAVTYGEPVDAIARQVQQNVIAELRTKIGLHDVAVNITVDDVIT